MTAPGVVVGVDLGTVRIGLAASDRYQLLASPLATVARDGAELDVLASLVTERAVVRVVVGLPTDLRGRSGLAAQAAQAFADQLQSRLGAVPVTLVDERLTTVVATRRIREAGGPKGRARSAVIDQEAAVAILQSFLDRPTDGPQP